MLSGRAEREILHGRSLSERDPEVTWGWGTPAGRVRARRRAELIASGARLGPGVQALEIGCGTGTFTAHFARTGANIVAVDISDDLLEMARARGLPRDRVRFVQACFEELEMNDYFDAIVGSSVLHHLDVGTALKEIHDLLRPGGIMSFAEPNMANPQIMIQKNVPWIKKRLGDSLDETAFFRWAFHRRLKAVGFEEIEITPFDWLHPQTPTSLIGNVSKAGRLLEKLPLVREFAGSLYIRCRRRAE